MTADIKLNGNIIEMIGEVMNHGENCGLSVADRKNPNERWEIYSDGGVLRFWHSDRGDVIRIFKDGLLQMVGKDPELMTGTIFWNDDAKLGSTASLLKRIKALEDYVKKHP